MLLRDNILLLKRLIINTLSIVVYKYKGKAVYETE